MTESRSFRVLRFNNFQVDLHTGELRKNGIRLKVPRQPFEVLALLLEHPGEAVTREELRGKLWRDDTFVDFDHSLNVAINKLRDVLSDSVDAPRYIQTLPRRGYRFLAAVEPVQQARPVPRPLPSGLPARTLSWKAVLLALVLVAVLASAFGFDFRGVRRKLLGQAAPRIQSLAVLPLTNLSGSLDDTYFADGMTEALITELAGISALKVTSRTSVMRYKHSTKPVKEIARELGVDAVVEGTVLRSADRVRITAQLIDTRTDSHLLSRTYEGGIRDVLALQSSAATAIADQIRVQILPNERARLSAAATVNPAAYEAYLKGRYFASKRTAEGLHKAAEYFQQAVDKDPAYAPAYAGLADTYFPLTNWGWLSPKEAMPKARAAAIKALEIDERLAEAHVSLGMVSLVYDWDWPAAGKHLEKALALNPAYPAAHQWYSNYLLALGRPDEALTEAKSAVDLDPVSADLNHYMAWSLGMARRYDEAIERERKTLELDPGFPPAHVVLASAYGAKGMYREALAEAEKLSGLSPGSPAALLSLASIHARSGDRSQALRELEDLKALSKQRYVPSDYIAMVYVRLGDKDQAFAWFEKAYEERTGFLPWLKVNAALDPLRSDPRFTDLLRRIGIPP
jgi:TolB-like protein/DNA-binding winged helix-turn-helix (wHTH) protein/Tfp pilus assembly protein PilF